MQYKEETENEKIFKFIREKVIIWWYISTNLGIETKHLGTLWYIPNIYNLIKNTYLDKELIKLLTNINNSILNKMWYKNNFIFSWKELPYITIDEAKSIKDLFFGILKEDKELEKKILISLLKKIYKDFFNKLLHIQDFLSDLKTNAISKKDIWKTYIIFEYKFFWEWMRTLFSLKEYMHNMLIYEFKNWNKEVVKEIFKKYGLIEKYKIWNDENIANFLENNFSLRIYFELINIAGWYFDLLNKIYNKIMTSSNYNVQNELENIINNEKKSITILKELPIWKVDISVIITPKNWKDKNKFKNISIVANFKI